MINDNTPPRVNFEACLLDNVEGANASMEKSGLDHVPKATIFVVCVMARQQHRTTRMIDTPPWTNFEATVVFSIMWKVQMPGDASIERS